MAGSEILDWQTTQQAVDSCAVCRSDNALVTTAAIPDRPWSPESKGRLLFISEAPPQSGGFWGTESEDQLRRNILGLLCLAGLRLSGGCTAKESLQSFLTANFFLIQAIKWPLHARSFNRLGPAERRKQIHHSAHAHLQQEISIISPRAIFAMGNAAWSACLDLQIGPLRLPEGGVELIRDRDYQIQFTERLVPLNVSYLPVDQNMNRVASRDCILRDLAHFLRRHDWYNAR
jgi:uracil-DNA glycosylase